jgi:hypothetical protein
VAREQQQRPRAALDQEPRHLEPERAAAAGDEVGAVLAERERRELARGRDAQRQQPRRVAMAAAERELLRVAGGERLLEQRARGVGRRVPRIEVDEAAEERRVLRGEDAREAQSIACATASSLAAPSTACAPRVTNQTFARERCALRSSDWLSASARSSTMRDAPARSRSGSGPASPASRLERWTIPWTAAASIPSSSCA